MIAVSDLGKSFGQQTLFAGVSIQFNPGNRYGLVGANGSGKSTFLKVLAGEEPPSEGTVSLPKRLRLGVLRQDHFRFEGHSILDVAMMGDGEVWRAMVDKDELLAHADREFDADRYAALEETILANDGYTLEPRAGEILEGLGIPSEVHRQPLSTLSGGFKLRVLLAQTLAARPDVLLLDEPTNHLDILSIRWLEKFLTDFAGTVIVISHDHRFLDNVCTHIADVDYETVTLYKGNYTAFEEQKVAERDRRELENSRLQKKIADHQAFVDRFRAKATKARQAQSKVKLIEKMADDLEPLPQSSRRYPVFRFRQSRPSGKEVLAVEGISKAYGEKQVLADVSLTVQRGDRVAIIGPNGIGKSTLLKIAMGEVKPDAGTAEWGYEARPGYFAQDHREQLGPGRQTVEAWLWDAAPSESTSFIRGKLGQVLFSGDEVEKKVSSLSGGEAARLVFCRLMVEQPNVLVLDEPTNHLDLEAIEALVEALQDYDGTLLFVSHDRWFVSRLAQRIVEITPGGLRDFRGTYDEYLERLGDDHLDAEAVLLRIKRDKKKAQAAPAAPPADDRELRRQLRDLTARRDRLTAEIDRAESRVGEINETFCDPTFFERTPRDKVAKLEGEQKKLRARVDELMAEWETVEGEIAEVEATLGEARAVG
ncbi:MAG TPA: ABC-F family ATP-binding cassette domain-containing protein [Thermoanaerobaculia bacterium]|nr:ABC-F family ATP-binding cassette domain-containing protein [Thermoanaerobaculia bacterium]